MTWEEPSSEDRFRVAVERVQALLDRVVLYLEFESIAMCETGRQKYDELRNTLADHEERIKTLEVSAADSDVL